jgi:hypothetical protein
VGVEHLSSSFRVSFSHRNLSLQSVTSRSGLRSGRMELLCPRLTSANSSRHLSTTVVRDKLEDLPGYCALTFTLMSAAYTHKLSVQVSDFEDIRLLIRLARLICDFCSSDQRFACGFLQIPPRDGHPCRPANDSPCRVRRRLSLPSKSALPGAPNKKAEVVKKRPPLLFSGLVVRVELSNRGR